MTSGTAHGDQREQFVEEVHGQQVGRQRDAQRDAVGHCVEQEKYFFVFLLRHILERVQRGQGPQGGDQAGEDHAGAVHPETDGEITRKVCQQKSAGGVMEQQVPHQNTVQYDGALQKDLPMSSLAKRDPDGEGCRDKRN